MSLINVFKSTVKLDDYATEGLSGTANSLAYRIEEIEKHFHSSGSWFETATSPSGTAHVADRIGTGGGAFQIDAGNDTWGDWLQILGSEDTPARTSQVYFDPHQIVISDNEHSDIYFVQFGRGASGAAALSAGTYTELALDLTSKAGGTIIPVHTGRAPAGSLVWARCMAPGNNTGTLDFFIGIHEYAG